MFRQILPPAVGMHDTFVAPALVPNPGANLAGFNDWPLGDQTLYRFRADSRPRTWY